MPEDERWVRAPGELELRRGGDPRIPGFLVAVMVVVVTLGLVVVVGAGSMILDGDLTSRPSRGRARWVTPPIALLGGLGLVLSPIAIIWQERGSRTERTGMSSTVVSLRRSTVTVLEGPARGFYRWEDLTDTLLRECPPAAQPVIAHHLAHPEHRADLGSRRALRRARSLS